MITNEQQMTEAVQKKWEEKIKMRNRTGRVLKIFGLEIYRNRQGKYFIGDKCKVVR